MTGSAALALARGFGAFPRGPGTAASFRLPADKQRTLVAYEAGLRPRAYVEPIGLAQPLPAMPLFLEPHLVRQPPARAQLS